ncbi:EF-P beta-lysylation protein EpmB [Francisella philomiragia]|uniref:L-lysine 2,3-aminomutase n=1 Tax=Francisella philomiragia TaxID=28110 RepID=A0AAW3DE61_9GAMM|nr:EF-P beta-lysylation protein EpmB [Francisella philomiragia]KFJ43895.1 kamA family protein [Francisella philomiragia]MBK2254409.1 EF-P beta-lysylation protein EpmB [Francisella philomiragia]MBK2272798.1 EF-P beta-lysylation protein EpmB [Francisella philomiragia]MBK2276563.1 EF-P beta-lysylation protein EpmB [Francisella philomiragia]MBK2280684.1 EF-P beta-lysylation protein EpmB [Francisella philomiragia]
MSTNDWKKALKESFYSPLELLEFLEIDSEEAKVSLNITKKFKMIVPRSFANRMQKGNINDPLLKQVLPTIDEEVIDQAYSSDPLDEKNYNKVPGLLHKYHGRVLLISQTSCAIHCRYCFRKEFDYKENVPGRKDWLKAFEYIANDQTIEEVILSGGDPLLNNDEVLEFFIENIQQISHIKRLRIHSRIPVVLPERMTNKLLKILSEHRLDTVLVIHVNHPNELDDNIREVLKEIHNHGIIILNQSTLLKDINDDANVLYALSTKLINAKVIPYYIHSLDTVSGTKHYNVDCAKDIMKKLSEISSGFMVPILTKEIPGYPSKKWLSFHS